ncbi:MAG: tetratricopeptide repeat protein, partial [Gammaproteobacteria bacterium]|nr:tetratricopeptide repeat protein [Gammaproteobacteria bacterium]
YEEILAKSAPGTIKSNFTAAQQAFAAGNLDKAAQHLQEILEQTPGHEQSTLLLGMIRFQQGRVKEAEALLAPYAQLDDATAATKLLAAAKLRLQQPGEARQLLEKLDESQSDPGVLALVAIASYASGDAKTGRDYMTKALSLAPDNAVLRQRYALLLQASGETAAAIQEFRTILERTPDSTEARIALVSLLMQQGDKAQAQSVIDDWLKRYPESLAAQITAGDLELQNGNADAANRYYQKALKQAPEDYRPHIAMGNLLASANKIELSLTHFEKAVSLAPENRAALRGLMAVANTAETHRARAQTFLKNLIAQKDEVVSPRLVLIEYGLVEGRLDEAAGYVESAIERSAQATDIHNLIATIYGNAAGFLMRQEKPAEAEAVVASGLKSFPEHEGLGLLAANLHFRKADELAAMEQLRQVKMHHPDSPRPFLMEAEYRVSKREFETAAELFRLAGTKAESIVEIPLQQAGALQNAGQKGKALEVLEATIQKFPEHAQTRLALALAYQTNNKTAEAVANYEQLLLKTPDNPVALNNLAWLYKEQGNPKAEELAARAYKASPDSAAIIDTYGWILFKQGKVSESIPLLERAHTLDPAMKEIALHLAEAYKAAGEEDKARAVLEKM